MFVLVRRREFDMKMGMKKVGDGFLSVLWKGVFVSLWVVGVWAQTNAKRLVVAPDGSGTHRTIQSAVEAAADGAVIEVRPGRYVGPVNIQKKVELRGVNWGEVTLTSDGAVKMKAIGERIKERFGTQSPGMEDRAEVEQVLAEFGLPLLKVKGCEGVVISGLKVTHGMMGDKNRLQEIALVEFDSAKVILSDSAVLGGPGNGIAVRNGSTVAVTNCLVAAQWGTGIAIGSGEDLGNRAWIVDSEIRNCYHRCITIRSDREVRVEQCRISGSAWHGIRYDDCSPVVEGCLIAESARSGIYASGKTSATARNNVFWRNGFSAWGANQDLIEGNTFVEAGVAIIAKTAPRIRNNLFQRNRVAITQSGTGGIRPEDVMSLEDISIEGNVFAENEGIWRGIMDHKVGIEKVNGSVLDRKGNKDAEGGVREVGKDFGLSEGFREKFPGVGSAAAFAAVSKWPLQPEEKAIIPEDQGSRDWQLWRNEQAE